MGQFFIVNSEVKLDYCIKSLRESWENNKWMLVNLAFTKRSLSSNAISHVWYREIGKFLNEDTENAKCYCKLNFGLAILRSDPKANKYFELTHIKWPVWNNELNKIVPELFQFDLLPYEGRLAAMKYMSVTSLFDTKQMKKYLAAVQRHFAEQGLVLEGKDAPKSDKAIEGG